MNINQNLRELINISKSKKDYLHEMLLLTQEQRKVIICGEIEQLNKLIDEKQVRIDTINSLDEQFEDGFGEIKRELNITEISSLASAGYETEARELKEEIKAIMEKIKEIVKVEKDNSDMFKEQKKQVNIKLQELKQNKLAANKFLNSKYSVPPNPAFFDKKK